MPKIFFWSGRGVVRLNLNLWLSSWQVVLAYLSKYALLSRLKLLARFSSMCSL